MSRGTAAVCARRCLRVAAAPTLLAATGCGIGAWATGTLVPWLHVSAFVPALLCCAAAVEFWPTFARGRAGADLVRSVTRRPLHGALAAGGGALLALALLLLGLAAGWSLLAPAPRAHRALAAEGRPLLDDTGGEVAFAVGGAPLGELQLRPIALLPHGDLEPTRVQVLADGAPLLAAPAEFRGSRQLLRVPLDGRRLDRLVLRRVSGTVPLLFADDAAVAVDQAPRARLLASALAFAPWLLPAALALALALLLGPFVGAPVALVTVGAALLLQTLGDLGPAAAALSLFARGHWLPAEPVFRDGLPSLGTAVVVMISAMLVRAGTRR
ncbi:MAG: hypothetical protein AB7O97_22480 [Planctomycetota bacterium]